VTQQMLIIAGKIYVDPGHRAEFVASHEDLMRRARAQPGCLDVTIAADPSEPGRVTMFEHWESEAHLAAWRAVADPPAPVTEFLGGDVQKHQISTSGPPFGQDAAAGAFSTLVDRPPHPQGQVGT